MLDVERLRALDAVATHGSVGAAAEALGVTPSAVSQKIDKLERETRATLLERHGRGVRLTDAARLLAEHARDILVRVERAESDFEAHRGEVVGELRVSAFPTAMRGLLPDSLQALAERYPRLRIAAEECEPPEAVREVARGSVDLAIVHDWDSLPLAMPDGLARDHLLDDVVDLAVPDGHRFADRTSVRLRDVADDAWIASPPGAVCHDMLVQTIRSYDLEPRIVHTASEFETQLAMVGRGHGIAILPRLGRGAIPKGVAVVSMRPSVVRSLYAVWRSHVARRPAIRAMVEAVRDVIDAR